MTKDIDGNNLSGKSGIRVERTLDGTPITDSEGKTIAELEEERAKLRGIEERSRIRLHSDRYLWGIYLMLLVFSVVELYSASSSEVKAANVYHPLMSHAMFLVVGLGVVMITQNIHYKYYRKFAWIFAFLSLILVWYGNHHGVMANGAMRAIRVMGFTIQPPEIAKLALVVVLARIMAKHQMRHGVTRQGVLLSLCMLAAFGLMLYSNGLTNTALIVIIATAMFVIGGTQLNKLAVIFCIFAVVGGIVYNTKFKTSDANAEGTATEMAANSTVGEAGGTVDRTELRQKRVTDFLEGVEPDDTVTDFNRQVFFANMSQAHGGLLGNGPGNSRKRPSAPGLLRLYFLHRGGRHRLRGRRVSAHPLPAVAGPCRRDSLQMHQSLPGTAHHRLRHSDSVPGHDSHGHRGGSGSGLGPTPALHLQRRHLDTRYERRHGHDALCKQIRHSAHPQDTGRQPHAQTGGGGQRRHQRQPHYAARGGKGRAYPLRRAEPDILQDKKKH